MAEPELASKLKWWQKQIVYQIYPRSFQDSNGDGIGDIPGIISRLDYLQELGIGIIWLSPIYKSPQMDYGYDISDYCEIAPEFGTMADFDRLLAEARKRGIRIIMDLVINHTSDQHQWFRQSRQPDSPYRDYYFWRPGRAADKSGNGKSGNKNTIVSSGGSARKKDMPNNWTSFFGEDCWVYDEISGEYYLHLFAKGQPDLNYWNPSVIAEIKNILRFWLDRGVAGFRCDVINVIYKDSLDNGRKKFILTGSEHYLSRPGTHEILRNLRSEVFDHYDCFTVGETVFVNTESGRDLCDPERRELDMIFSFEHMETDQILVKWFKRRFRPKRFGRVISRWQQALCWPANYLENHDQPRCVTRFGDDKKYWRESAKLLAVLLLTLKGTPFIYQGQEIGMTNFDYTTMDQLRDIESFNIDRLAGKLHIPSGYRWRMMQRTSRDNARTPMQWSSEIQAGFSSGEPWLAVNQNFQKINAKDQQNDPDSIFSFYRQLISLRSENIQLLAGEFRLLAAKRKYLAYERLAADADRMLIFLNFSRTFINLPDRGVLVLSNYPRNRFDGRLMPYESIILKVKSEGEI
jgi:oligo-1,6-glucosidase